MFDGFIKERHEQLTTIKYSFFEYNYYKKTGFLVLFAFRKKKIKLQKTSVELKYVYYLTNRLFVAILVIGMIGGGGG